MATRRSWASEHGYLVIVLALLTVFTAMFVVAEQLQLPLLTNPPDRLDQASWPAALIGIALLVSDVFLPIPSSAVMLAQGAAFGLVVGALLSLVGGTGATLVAFLVGRRSRGLMDRLVPADQRRRGAELLERHGMWAIVVTRPVPMLAETVAILAGTGASLPWWKVAIAGAIGNLVPAAAYAAAGAYAATYVSGLAVFAGVLVLALITWLWQGRSAAPQHQD